MQLNDNSPNSREWQEIIAKSLLSATTLVTKFFDLANYASLYYVSPTKEFI